MPIDGGSETNVVAAGGDAIGRRQLESEIQLSQQMPKQHPSIGRLIQLEIS